MRWPAAGLFAAGLALVLAWLPAAAQTLPVAAPPLVLKDALGAVDGERHARYWIDPTGKAGLEQAIEAAGRFRPVNPGEIHKLGPEAALWLHLRLQRAPDERQEWLVEFPVPVLDLATAYQWDGDGWRGETAGDTVPVASWPEPGRYPFFRLELPSGETRDVLVRIRHTTAANFPMEVVTAARHSDHAQVEYLALGGAFGALLLLIVACLARAWVYRERVFAWYGVYAALTSLAVAAYTGTAAHLLWPRFGALQDAPGTMLACAATGAAMLFVRDILGLRRRFPRQDRLMRALGIAGMALVPVAATAPKTLHLPVMAAYIGFATVAGLLAALGAAWRGDVVGKWVFAAYVPMVLSVLAGVARVFGWVPLSFGSQYSVVVAMTIEVPLLLVALFMRSRDRHNAEIREQALSTQDALTGLLAPHLFHDRLRQVVARHRREGDSAAVMYIDLVNHRRIRETLGTAAAEQSLLRSVIKLRRLLRDVDTVSRVGEARFGVILEGASTRQQVTERAARLIAAGLMPLPGLKPDVTLQFHVAALLLDERVLEAEEAQAALAAQLSRMSPRTRRPIRFIAPEQQLASDPAAPDSSMFAPDADVDAGPATRGRGGLSAVR